MSRPLILVTCRQMQVELPRHRAIIEGLGYDVYAPDLGDRQQFSAAELVALGEGARLVGIIAGDDDLSKDFFEGTPNLRVLVRWGIGMDSVDHVAAAANGVTVRNTPGVFNDEVADSALAHLLALARGVVRVDRDNRAGKWTKFEGVTLAGSRVGVVGLGGIGQAIVKRLLAFGADVVGYDPYAAKDLDVSRAELNDLLPTVRFLILACPLTPETYHLLDRNALSSMRADALIVNVARGPIVDEFALSEALGNGQIAGAALDVFEVEPLPSDSPLRSHPNVILGAHNGSNTREGVARASDRAAQILLEELT